MAGPVDPTVAGNYPVILGDGLLGKTSNEIFTGVRYNHKPQMSSDAVARLKPSIPGQTSSYDLTFNDNDDKYSFAGKRTTDDDQYVLYFDPERKVFILDKVDSTFNMNITRLRDNTNPDSLSRQHPHIDGDGKLKATASKPAVDKDKSKRPQKARAASPLAVPRRKPEKKQGEAAKSSLGRSAESSTKAKPKRRKSLLEDDEEEDDDDGGLLVEYPGADPRSKQKDFSPAFTAVRRFDDYMDQRESEAEDADAESDLEPDNTFKLPSPGYGNSNNKSAERVQDDSESEPEMMDVDKHEPAETPAGDDDFDLEKDLEDAFENIKHSSQETPPDDESEISEED